MRADGAKAVVSKLREEKGTVVAKRFIRTPKSICFGLTISLIATFAFASLLSAKASSAPLTIKGFDGGVFSTDGIAENQAASHPHIGSTSIEFDTEMRGANPGDPPTFAFPLGNAKDITVELPPGFIGDPNALPKCTAEQLLAASNPGGVQAEDVCPPEAQVGVLHYSLVLRENDVAPIYNIVPPAGKAAMFGAPILRVGVQTFHGSVRTDDDYGINVRVERLTQEGSLFWSEAIFWGTPADPSHTDQRGYEGNAACAKPTSDCAYPSSAPLKPLLALPTTCIGPVETRMSVNSWQEPEFFDHASFLTHEAGDPNALIGNEGCGDVPFDPSLTLSPSSESTDSPTGMGVKLSLPQDWKPGELVQSHLNDTIVTLPEGLTMNPAAASGLEACSTAQIGLITTTGAMPNPIRFNKAEPACPDASKLGTVLVKTPLLEESDYPTGHVYLARQGDNPFGIDYAIYLVIESEQRGFIAKLAGKVEPDPVTGQLKSTFANNPQLPFSSFELEFKGGPRAPLATPPVCGATGTQSDLTSWSRPGDVVNLSDPYVVDSSPAGGCPQAEEHRPFSVELDAGSASAGAGEYSPFHVRFQRSDGNQEFDRIELSTPEGFAGKLAGIPYCPEASIARAIGRTATGDGKLEKADPSCPAASHLGTTMIGAGAGPNPFYVSGNAYLAGPYKGSPVSMVFVVPAVAGPFDLGVQVVRAQLQVNERTAQITTVSDAIPQILRGIPVRIKDIRVDVDRPGFTLNPTDCSEMQVSGRVFGASGGVTSVSNRFQVDGCRDLGFKAKFRAKILDKGRRSTLRSFNPRTRFTVVPRPGDANIGGARVALPTSTILDQSNLDTTCTRAQMAAEDCPAGSIVGFARAWSPLLDRPVQGPVYLAANGGVRPLPDIVAVLDGQVRVSLLGEVATLRTRGRARLQNTFRVVPDAPVNRFVLTMRGGKNRGLLVNSTDLCRSKERGVAVFNAHNGRQSRQNLRIGVSFKGCKRVRKQAARRAAKRKIARKKAKAARVIARYVG